MLACVALICSVYNAGNKRQSTTNTPQPRQYMVIICSVSELFYHPQSLIECQYQIKVYMAGLLWAKTACGPGVLGVCSALLRGCLYSKGVE